VVGLPKIVRLNLHFTKNYAKIAPRR